MNERLDGMGKRIKDRRKELNLTQEKLAEILGKGDTKGTISKWENEKTIVPTADFPALCNALECDVGYLFGKDDCPSDIHRQIMDETGLSALAVDNLLIACNCPDKIDPSLYAAEKDLMDYEIGKKAKFHLIRFFLEDNGLASESLLEQLSVAIYQYMKYSGKNDILSWNTDKNQLRYSDYAEIALDVGINKLKQAIRGVHWDVSSWEV